MTQYIINNKWRAAAYVPVGLAALVLLRCSVGSSASHDVRPEYQSINQELIRRSDDLGRIQEAASSLQEEVHEFATSAAVLASTNKITISTLPEAMAVGIQKTPIKEATSKIDKL